MKNPKEMFNAMNNLYEGKNINGEIALRTQLKDVKMHVLENYVKEEVVDPEGNEDKGKHKKDLVKSKRIIPSSIGSHMYHPVRRK